MVNKRSAKALTRREGQVLDLVVRNIPIAKIAQLLGISPRTVEDFMANVRKKYGVTNQIGLMRAAYQITDAESIHEPDSIEAAPTSRYRHTKTGGTYRLMYHALIEHNLLPAVVYRSESDNTAWVRPALEFFDGRFQPIEEIEGDPGDFEDRDQEALDETRETRLQSNTGPSQPNSGG